MADFATWQDVQNRWPDHPLTAGEQTVATTRIGEASAQLRIQVPDLDDRLAAGDDNLVTLTTGIVANAVLRSMQNPMGATQLSEAAGPFSHSMTLPGAAVGVYFTDAELMLLRPSVNAIGTSYVGVRPSYARTAPYPKKDAFIGGQYTGTPPWGELSQPWWW